MANGFKKKIGNLVDYFIPASDFDDEQELRTSRIRVSLFLISAFLFLLYIPSALSLRATELALINVFVSPLILIVAFLYKNGIGKITCVNLYMAATGTAIFAGVYYQGGILMTTGIVLVPAISMLIGGKKVAYIWLGVTILFLSLIYYLANDGYVFTTTYDPSLQNYVIYSGVFGVVVALFFSLMVFESQKERALQAVIDSNENLNIEKQKSDKLLLNILPEDVAQELKDTGATKARFYETVTILFTDFIGFTGISERLSPNELVEELNRSFTAFDEIMEKNGLEKIKTIGDAYLAVGGMYGENDHASKTINAAKEMVKYLNETNGVFKIRAGIHTGSVIGGVVGKHKYVFDIWGDAVNFAARMEQNSDEGKINISEDTYHLVKNDFKCLHRGKIEAKNKGSVDMYFVE